VAGLRGDGGLDRCRLGLAQELVLLGRPCLAQLVAQRRQQLSRPLETPPGERDLGLELADQGVDPPPLPSPSHQGVCARQPALANSQPSLPDEGIGLQLPVTDPAARLLGLVASALGVEHGHLRLRRPGRPGGGSRLGRLGALRGTIGTKGPRSIAIESDHLHQAWFP